jgi:hypothetical protein
MSAMFPQIAAHERAYLGVSIRWAEIYRMTTISTRLRQHLNAPRADVYRARLVEANQKV